MPRRTSPRIPLPSPFESEPFSLAQGAAAGLGDKRMRGKDLATPYRGARWRADRGFDFVERCQAYAARSPSGRFFCSTTAARILGIPVRASESILHVGVAAPHRAPRGAGISGHMLEVTSADLLRVQGVWVTSHARTWRDLSLVCDIPDLVAAGDHLLRWCEVPIAHLEDVVPPRGRRGSTRLRQALPLLDPRAESPQESRLRALLVLGGLPVPLANPTIRIPGGRWAYRLDLAYLDERVAIEYQGGYHHDPRQWADDMTRRTRLRAHGWEVVELTKFDLRDPVELVERIRRILHSRHVSFRP